MENIFTSSNPEYTLNKNLLKFGLVGSWQGHSVVIEACQQQQIELAQLLETSKAHLWRSFNIKNMKGATQKLKNGKTGAHGPQLQNRQIKENPTKNLNELRPHIQNVHFI